MAVRNVVFKSGEVSLAGTLTQPDTLAVTPTVILLPGSGHHDRDETVCNQKPFQTIALNFAAHGIASLRFDSRGTGESNGEQETVSFTTKVEDALSARSFLVNEWAVAAEQVAYIGHSEGGLVAAAASRKVPTPLVMLSGPVIPIAELLHAQARVQSLAAGATEVQIAYEQLMNEQVFDVASSSDTAEVARDRLARIIADALRNWPGASWENTDQIIETTEAMVSIVLANDYRSLLQQQSAEILADVKAPILALFGELDCKVDAERNLQAYKTATRNNASAEAVVIDGHNHLFQVASSGGIDEYETLGDAPSPETLAHIRDWLRKILTP